MAKKGPLEEFLQSKLMYQREPLALKFVVPQARSRKQQARRHLKFVVWQFINLWLAPKFVAGFAAMAALLTVNAVCEALGSPELSLWQGFLFAIATWAVAENLYILIRITLANVAWTDAEDTAE